MFKTSNLSVLKFSFLSLYSFRIENPNRMSILTQNYASFWEICSYIVKDKIEIVKNFLYEMDKVRKNQNLIHLSESF
jgi:hypothetical protein